MGRQNKRAFRLSKRIQDTKQSERGSDSHNIYHHPSLNGIKNMFVWFVFFITIPWHLLIAN